MTEGIMSSCIFIGYILGSLIFVNMTDKFGRRKFLIAGYVECLVAYIGMLFVNDIYYMFAIMVLFGIATAQKASLGYVTAMEMMPEKQRNIMGGIF
jgi:MFS family permease